MRVYTQIQKPFVVHTICPGSKALKSEPASENKPRISTVLQSQLKCYIYTIFHNGS